MLRRVNGATERLQLALKHARWLQTTSVSLRAEAKRRPSYSAPPRKKEAEHRFGRTQFGSRTPGKASWPRLNPSPVAGPSNLTVNGLYRKLQDALGVHWSHSSIYLTRLANDLGVDKEAFFDITSAWSRKASQHLQDLVANKRQAARKGLQFGDPDLLKAAYVQDGQIVLLRAILQAFLGSIRDKPVESFAKDPSSSLFEVALKLKDIANATDLRFPGELYSEARQQRRKIILHVGPTNSGKTHSALVALARAKTGVYAGPLRLLAHEIFTRFNEGKIGDEGKRTCNLITGEEQRILDPNAALSSCTVEMFPLARRLSVGVIDEIQMIGDDMRGSSWTSAVIGSRCDELHLCGEESVVDLVQKIARELGDECIVNRYQRLSPLVVAEKSLESDLTKIRHGDCLVTFSRTNIFAFKRLIEAKTNLRVAVAYGGLPPEVREEQARAFNAGEYDVLVASDAVGMGLNLKIKRIVFESVHKWNGKQEVQLPIPQIKQIAGRAGRYGVHSSPSGPDDVDASSNTTLGEVTTLDEKDMDVLRKAMKEPTVQINQARLEPPFERFKDVYSRLPSTVRTSRIFELVGDMTATLPHYNASSSSRASSQMFDAIEHIQGLSFAERAQFAAAPVNLRDQGVLGNYVHFVEQFAVGEPIDMDKWAASTGLQDILARVDDERERLSVESASQSSSTAQKGVPLLSPITLQKLESFHRSLTLYLWLSYRLPDIFCDQDNARLIRRQVESSIDFVLSKVRFERQDRRKPAKGRQPQTPMSKATPDAATEGLRATASA